MPTRITNFMHVNQTTGTTALSNAFVDSRTHNLGDYLPVFNNGRFWQGIIDSVNIHVHAIAGGATKLTVRVTSDAAGNESIIPDVQATIATGIGIATQGSIAISAGFAFTNQNPNQSDVNVYVWVKTDVGTCNLKESTIVWRE